MTQLILKNGRLMTFAEASKKHGINNVEYAQLVKQFSEEKAARLAKIDEEYRREDWNATLYGFIFAALVVTYVMGWLV